MKERETTFCEIENWEIERVWVIWVWVWVSHEIERVGKLEKEKKEPSPVVVVVQWRWAEDVGHGVRKSCESFGRERKVWEYFRRKGNRFDKVVLGFLFLFWVCEWEFLGLDAKKTHEKKRKERQRKGKKIRINLLRIWVMFWGRTQRTWWSSSKNINERNIKINLIILF